MEKTPLSYFDGKPVRQADDHPGHHPGLQVVPCHRLHMDAVLSLAVRALHIDAFPREDQVVFITVVLQDPDRMRLPEGQDRDLLPVQRQDHLQVVLFFIGGSGAGVFRAVHKDLYACWRASRAEEYQAEHRRRGGQQGTIGVIGPTRMQYSKVLAILNIIGHQLTDMFTLFFVRFVKNYNGMDENAWSHLPDGKRNAWQGYAYEQVCIHHINQIKKALGISGIASDVCSWTKKGENGAQIDLVIDRSDRVIDLCEIK